jgi:hypothetical protein
MVMSIEISGKGDLEMDKVFVQAYKNSFIKSTEYVFGKCFEYAPIAKSSKGAVNLRNALAWDFDYVNFEGFIGIPLGSEVEKIAFYTEFGTGFRGEIGWKVYYDEKMPNFEIPILPKKTKAMHFVTDEGKDVFFKEGLGQSPQAWMRRAFKDSEKAVNQIWKKEFSNTAITELLNLKNF